MSDLDCRTCGACCRSPFAAVPVQQDDVIKNVYPDALEIYNGKIYVKRFADKCSALIDSSDETCSCAVYEYRPRVCRDFAPGGHACLDARKRLGLG